MWEACVVVMNREGIAAAGVVDMEGTAAGVAGLGAVVVGMAAAHAEHVVAVGTGIAGPAVLVDTVAGAGMARGVAVGMRGSHAVAASAADAVLPPGKGLAVAGLGLGTRQLLHGPEPADPGDCEQLPRPKKREG